MSAYNLINGVHADMNEHTLKEILRKEWQYDGLGTPVIYFAFANGGMLEW